MTDTKLQYMIGNNNIYNNDNTVNLLTCLIEFPLFFNCTEVIMINFIIWNVYHQFYYLECMSYVLLFNIYGIKYKVSTIQKFVIDILKFYQSILFIKNVIDTIK